MLYKKTKVNKDVDMNDKYRFIKMLYMGLKFDAFQGSLTITVKFRRFYEVVRSRQKGDSSPRPQIFNTS